VRPGRFVVPAAPRVRSLTVAVAVAAWLYIPVMVVQTRRTIPEWNERWVAGVMAVLALAVTVIAARAWFRTMELTPDGLVVRAIFHEPLRARWDRAFPDLVEQEGPARLWGVAPDVITGAINEYHDHPERRAAIGTEAEHARLLAVLGDRLRASA
jgi:hypothetical protein